MKTSARQIRLALCLLGITVLLWALALLFLLRVVNIFDAYLMKFPGPVVIFGTMIVGPLVAIWLGVRMIRAGQRPALSWGLGAAGGVLFLAFVGVVGVPMLEGALTPAPPRNPSAPRQIELPAGLPVFPGAEGFGTRTVAGRGGRVIEVTSLADDGPGTLRAALEAPYPRTVVFRTGGTIVVESELLIRQPYVTVAGQTAPGGGICIKGAGLTISTHDVLVQHIRVRPGNEGPVDADINDSVAILGPHGDLEGAYNVVLDHVSASWSEDETISTWYGAHDVTISWSIISEALNRSRHRKVTHSAGLLIGDSSYNVSVHHNLLAHNDFRNPLISEGGTHDIVNNVIYDWGAVPGEIVDNEGNSFVNFVGNTFIPGLSTQSGPYEILFTGGEPRIYVRDNMGPHRPDPSLNEWVLVGFGWGEEGVAPESYRSPRPFPTWPITTQSASVAHELVLSHAGAALPLRDSVDERVVGDVKAGTGAIIDSPKDVGGYPHLAAGSSPPDADHDGMPDGWEREWGLNPVDAVDGNGDLDGDGYTNVEEYLHSLAGDG